MSTRIRSLRIITGLYLFVFVSAHLLSLAFGLVSLDAMETASDWLMGFWHFEINKFLLLVAFVSHLFAGLQALYARNTLNMRSADSLQFLTAFLVVPVLMIHMVTIATMEPLFGMQPSFPALLDYFWKQDPAAGLRQVLLVILVWLHGCIGLLGWLRLRDWWPRVSMWVNPLLVAVPVLALLGFVEGGQHVNAMGFASGPQGDAYGGAYGGGNAPPTPDPQSIALLGRIIGSLLLAYVALLAITLLARAWRLRGKGEALNLVVDFEGVGQAQARTGLNLLELASTHDLPHPNLCRGRGRCGTCRVRIADAGKAIPPPSDLEQHTLTRVGADAGQRLACQLVLPPGHYRVVPVLRADLSENRCESEATDGDELTPGTGAEGAA